MKRLAALGAGIALCHGAGAWPVFDEALDVAGSRFYPDSESSTLWWQAVDEIRLAAVDGTPFQFVRYRYTGSAATGDSGATWAQGLLTFHIVLGRPLADVQQARAALARELGRPVTIRTVPVDSLEAGVAMASPESEPLRLASGTFADAPAPGSPYPVQLVMTPAVTQVFWRAMQEEPAAMSAHFDLAVLGYASRPEDEEETPEPVAQTVFAGVVPVAATAGTCTACFRSHDVGAANPRALPTVDVFCCDAGESAADGPALVVLELEAPGIDGGRVREKRHFDASARTGVERIEFSHAVEMRSGYRYRVNRVFESGALQTSGWREAPHWVSLLDISAAAFAGPEAAR